MKKIILKLESNVEYALEEKLLVHFPLISLNLYKWMNNSFPTINRDIFNEIVLFYKKGVEEMISRNKYSIDVLYHIYQTLDFLGGDVDMIGAITGEVANYFIKLNLFFNKERVDLFEEGREIKELNQPYNVPFFPELNYVYERLHKRLYPDTRMIYNILIMFSQKVRSLNRVTASGMLLNKKVYIYDGNQLSILPNVNRDDVISIHANRTTTFFVCKTHIAEYGINVLTHEYEDDILLFSCGLTHMMCLTTGGLFASGSNEYGELSLGFKSKNHLQKRPVPVEGSVLMMKSGDNFNVILTDHGLFVSGDNRYGSLGLPTNEGPLRISKLTHLEVEGDVISFDCGSSHTILLTTEGLFGFGRNSHYQTGIRPEKEDTPQSKNNVLIPTRIDFNHKEILSVHCSGANSFLLTNSGAMYACGWNRGHLGISEYGEDITSFTRVGMKEKIHYVWPSEKQTIILKDDGLFVCGNNETRQFNKLRINLNLVKTMTSK